MSRDGYGRIEIICGSMFSGKTEELIRRLRRAVIAKQKVQVFKPIIDQRYHVEKVTSHNGAMFEALPVETAVHINQYHIYGDFVQGDKFAGDKVMGDKHEHHHHHYPPEKKPPPPPRMALKPPGDFVQRPRDDLMELLGR